MRKNYNLSYLARTQTILIFKLKKNISSVSVRLSLSLFLYVFVSIYLCFSVYLCLFIYVCLFLSLFLTVPIPFSFCSYLFFFLFLSLFLSVPLSQKHFFQSIEQHFLAYNEHRRVGRE
jgi:hypothetical protein